jgi:hypothetical protein
VQELVSSEKSYLGYTGWDVKVSGGAVTDVTQHVTTFMTRISFGTVVKKKKAIARTLPPRVSAYHGAGW